MPNINQLLTGIDNWRKRGARQLSDLVTSPVDTLDQMGTNAAQVLRNAAEDPLSYVGGGAGLGRTILRNAAGEVVGSAPTQAELAGRLHSMRLADPAGVHRLYNLQDADPELLELIERETIRRGPLWKPKQ